MGNELTLLKQYARREGVDFDQNLGDSKLHEELWTSIQNLSKQSGLTLLDEIIKFRTIYIRMSRIIQTVDYMVVREPG